MDSLAAEPQGKPCIHSISSHFKTTPSIYEDLQNFPPPELPPELRPEFPTWAPLLSFFSNQPVYTGASINHMLLPNETA